MSEFLKAIDPDGQPVNVYFNRKRNVNKAAACLMGILNGITADKELKDIEIFFLENWLDNQEEYKGDILDIYDAIKTILKDNVITKEEKEDLTCLINDCIEFGPKIFEDDKEINQFIGFLKGIAADDTINNIEFDKLRIELEKYKHLMVNWPMNIIGKRVMDIIKDNVVTTNELKDLCELVQDITGTKFTKYGDAIGCATTLFNDKIDSFSHENVCLTGKFISGTRMVIKNRILELGAISQDNVTLQTDILIIGNLGSRDWIHTSTGRKIEKAVQLKNEGQKINITTEQAVFASYL